MNTNLLKIREDNDLKQQDIADILNVTQQTYSIWENNIKIIPLERLNSLSNYYNVSMDYLLKLSNNKKNYNKLDKLNKKEIGIRLRKIRKENNLTLVTLAKYLNTTISTLSAYENGKTMILTAFAYQICKKYNVSLDYLCGKKDYQK